MRSCILFAALFWILGFSVDSVAEEKAPHSADEVQAAFDRFVQAAAELTRRPNAKPARNWSLWGPLWFPSHAGRSQPQ